MRDRTPRTICACRAVVVASVAVAGIALTGCWAGIPPTPAGVGVDGRVTRVIDGDSIEVDGRAIRLIGINAPERGQPDHEPSRDALARLLDGRDVRLEHDVEVRDQYGRELAYVFLPDGRHVNEEMVRAGFAQVYTIAPNVAHAAGLRAAEEEARAAGRGLWRPSDLSIDIAEVVFDPPGPDGENLNGEWVVLFNRGERSVSIGGLILSDESNNVFTLPERNLAPGTRLWIFTGSGEPSETTVYLGRSVPLWNNDGDTVFLRDAEGRIIARYAYGDR